MTKQIANILTKLLSSNKFANFGEKIVSKFKKER